MAKSGLPVGGIGELESRKLSPTREVSNCALVICTRNRPIIFAQTLSFLEKLALPEILLIVDSSDNTDSENIVKSSSLHKKIVYLKSERGLPPQRNVAMMYLRNMQVRNFSFVSFLDDDVLSSESYFLECRKLFKNYPSAICIGGFDEINVSKETSPHKIAKALGIIASSHGQISKAGFCSVPTPEDELTEVRWVPAGM